MKYSLLLILFIFSCDFYTFDKIIVVSGVETGRIIFSSAMSYEVLDIYNETEITLSLSKGEYYYITYYPNFYGRESRFPYGAVVDLSCNFVTMSPHLGLLTKECNLINKIGGEVNIKSMLEVKDMMLKSDDPWVYDRDDLILSLRGDLSYGSISKESVLNIPELNLYYAWIPENKLFTGWYKSVQSFYNLNSNSFYRIIINEDSTYNGFEEVK